MRETLGVKMKQEQQEEHKQVEDSIFNLRDIMPQIEMPNFDLGYFFNNNDE